MTSSSPLSKLASQPHFEMSSTSTASPIDVPELPKLLLKSLTMEKSFAMDFTIFSEQVLYLLDTDIERVLSHANLPQPLQDACRYAMTGSGKRVRPLLVASSYWSIQQSNLHSMNDNSRLLDDETALDESISITVNDTCRRAMLSTELLHAYSLIHDDLPALDDDDLRRGRPTCHIQFDEATALLAGDVLQTLAFEVLTADMVGFETVSAQDALLLNQIFAPRARRMVAGQMLDIKAENTVVSQHELEAIHRDKTGALIEAAVLMGGVCAQATVEQMSALYAFSDNIGLAFQVQDDILDVTASTEVLGKPVGSDEALDKSTYVKLMGVAKAIDYAQSLFMASQKALTPLVDTRPLSNQDADTELMLLALAQWLWDRKK